jgi:hypothetical protein
VKHNNKDADTEEFFELFFSKYIDYVNINKGSKFIFVMKKLNRYEDVLEKILERYSYFDVKLMIIEDKYTSSILDKNKDDFLCQYIFYILRQRGNVTLISNDKYRDRESYIRLFTFDNITLQTMSCDNGKCVDKKTVKFEVNRQYTPQLAKQNCARCTIPKNKLNAILT